MVTSSLRRMAPPVLYSIHSRFFDHDSGYGHPERPARLRAVDDGIDAAGLREALSPVVPTAAPTEALTRIHPPLYLRAIEEFCEQGGGYLDGDTHVGPASWDAARMAAGAGLEVIRRLEAGDGDVGFCAVRPPGHHATSDRAMGFCLVNNVAVAAADLAARGERVVIVDYDAHHGNGTQDIFWSDPNVFYVSMHEWPLYPGTGRATDVGADAGRGPPSTFRSRRARRASRTGPRSTRSCCRSWRRGGRRGCWCRRGSTATAATRSPTSGSRRATSPI